MGSRRSSRERLLLATLVVAVAALIVVKSPSLVESRVSNDGNAPEASRPGLGWERGFRHLAVGP